MTNQEAIDELIIVRNVYDGMREAYKPCVEAIDMAISALQALDEIYAFIMKSEASETTDGVLEIFDALEAQELSKNSAELEKKNGDLQPTCNQLATDTISRQAAIDAITDENMIRNMDSVMDSEIYRAKRSIHRIIASMPSAQPEPQWIPCSERLPEENVPVLLGVRFKDDFKFFVSARIDYNYWSGLGREIKGELRWMPLPEPYRAERRTDGSDISKRISC